jgi:hypothetical protein
MTRPGVPDDASQPELQSWDLGYFLGSQLATVQIPQQSSYISQPQCFPEPPISTPTTRPEKIQPTSEHVSMEHKSPSSSDHPHVNSLGSTSFATTPSSGGWVVPDTGVDVGKTEDGDDDIDWEACWNSLKNHGYSFPERVHSEEAGPFRCTRLDPRTQTQCGREFGTLSNLARHERTHDNKRFPCNICGRRLSRADLLRRHLKDIHGQKLPPPASRS